MTLAANIEWHATMKMKREDVVRNLRDLANHVDEKWQTTVWGAIEELEKGSLVHYHLAPNHTVKQVGELVKIDAA